MAHLSASVVTGDFKSLVSMVMADAKRNATQPSCGCCENISAMIEQQEPTIRMQRWGDGCFRESE